MEQYEYGRLESYTVAGEGLPRGAYVLHEERGWTLLTKTSALAALNEIGSNGWVVYGDSHFTGASPSLNMKNDVLSELQDRYQIERRVSVFAQKDASYYLRRVKPSAP